jgi:hypothetical protein
VSGDVQRHVGALKLVHVHKAHASTTAGDRAAHAGSHSNDENLFCFCREWWSLMRMTTTWVLVADMMGMMMVDTPLLACAVVTSCSMPCARELGRLTCRVKDASFPIVLRQESGTACGKQRFSCTACVCSTKSCITACVCSPKSYTTACVCSTKSYLHLGPLDDESVDQLLRLGAAAPRRHVPVEDSEKIQ